jgi:hypothetical protein
MGGDLVLTPNDSAIIFSSGAGRFFAGGAERLKIFSTGKIQSNSSIAGDVIADFRNTSTTGYGLAVQAGSNSSTYSLKVVNYNDSSTYFYVRADGNTGIGTAAPDFQLEVKANTTNYSTMVKNSSATTPNGLYIYFDQSSSSNTTQQFLRAESTAGHKAAIYTSGTFGSATSTYGSLVSDIRLKENVVEASSKLNDLLKLRVVNFNLIEDLDKRKQIGFIAQEFKEIFPSLVYERDTREYDEDGNIKKGLEDAMAVSVGMDFAILVKAIQEMNTKIIQLEKIVATK